MPKRVAVLQSNYIPWKGYFDIIHDVDEFIFLDDVQYTRQDWRNRNRIKTAHGVRWLTIPVGTSLHRRICDVKLPAGEWADDHWRRIELSYAAAPHFGRYRAVLEEIYRDRKWTRLADFNQQLIRTISEWLGITTRFRDSRVLGTRGQAQDRVLDLVGRAGADVYVSGPAARAYIEPQRFARAGIELHWKDYSGYPEYPQFYPPFVHEVTVLDLLFHTGPEAPYYIWGWR
ncbi:MAG TPA: WbqC family protein [Gemmatimonadaceae bacterium]|nr:MAG: hypothetical protein DMF56_02735 [Acidobacteriota bacterium]HTD83230.1 WbqC family protein [Gemmatimonadaceae bacterium]